MTSNMKDGMTKGWEDFTSLSSPFIRRPIGTSLLMLLIVLLGFLSYRFLPVSALPQIDYPTIRVSTYYPGASPDVMASLITAPLEKQFGIMAGLDQMTSSSSNGASMITLRFALETKLDIAEQEVQAAINAASRYLPTNLPNPPIYNKVNPADFPIVTLSFTAKNTPLYKVQEYVETRFSQKIAQISGVGLVSISGAQRPSVRVQCNPRALAQYGLTLEDVRTALSQANSNLPKGSFDGPLQTYVIDADAQILTSAETQNQIILYREGAPIRVSDVATVVDAAENRYQIAWKDRNPAIIVTIQRQPGANILEVVDRIKTMMPKLTDGLPKDVTVELLNDRTKTIRASVDNALHEMILAIFLVLVVVFVFLGNPAATLIPSIAIPLSLIGTFIFIYLMGFSINNLSIMALTIATGFVVDDAIVMLENISRYIELGMKPFEAALRGAKQIGFTIVSLTISLIAVLIPLLFMEDLVGRLFKEFAITLSVSILISAFISLTLTPMLCSRWLSHTSSHKPEAQWNLAHKAIVWMTKGYAKTLTWVLSHESLVLAITSGTFVVTVGLFIAIPKGFFPTQDTGLIQGIVEGPQDISFSAMKSVQESFIEHVLKDPDVESITSFMGIDGINTTLNAARLMIALKPIEQGRQNVSQIIQRLQALTLTSPLIQPGSTLFLQPIQDLTISDRISHTQYQYGLNAPNGAEITQWTERLVHAMSQSPLFTDVSSDQLNGGKYLYININRPYLASLGLTVQDVDNALYNAFGQHQISTLFTSTNQYYMILEVDPKLQTHPDDLESIYLKSAGNDPIPLTSLVSISERPGALVINRQGQFPSSLISFNLTPGVSLGEAVKGIEDIKKSIAFPNSILSDFEGTARVFRQSLANQFWLVIAAIVVVYIVLGVLYESYIHPITILSTLPSAGMGALIAMMITGEEFGIVALIGIILLIGIVKKNAIMIIDFALEGERGEGKSPRDAIYDACLVRLRPILMTTFSAIMGAIPLAISVGMGAEIRRPLGISIIGGLLLSQLLTLYTTPVIYLTFDRWSRTFPSFVSTVFKKQKR